MKDKHQLEVKEPFYTSLLVGAGLAVGWGAGTSLMFFIGYLIAMLLR